MQRLLKFKLCRECREIAVNPAKVLYVSQYMNGASELHFSRECCVRVQGDLDEVTKKIEAALCEDAVAANRFGASEAGVANVN